MFKMLLMYSPLRLTATALSVLKYVFKRILVLGEMATISCLIFIFVTAKNCILPSMRRHKISCIQWIGFFKSDDVRNYTACFFY